MSYPYNSRSEPKYPKADNTPFGSLSARSGNTDKIHTNRDIGETTLAFAHLSGWSAELISNRVNESFGCFIAPENVWDNYKAWIMGPSRIGDTQPMGHNLDVEHLADILRECGLEPDRTASRLDRTPRPISTTYAHIWYPQLPTPPILEGFTDDIRKECIGYLSWHASDAALLKPAPKEQLYLDKLGPDVCRIIGRLLPQWLGHTKKKILELPFTRRIGDHNGQWVDIVLCAKEFKRVWESVFRKMDDDHTILPDAPLEGTTPISIRSTGAAAKVFFCLMLVNRLLALDARRTYWRNETCFLQVAVENLPEDVKICHICQETLGSPNEDGEIEMPVQVVACCGNYFGGNCLRKWYGDFDNGKCPLCNWPASSLFREKLCFQDEFIEEGYEEECVEIQHGSYRRHGRATQHCLMPTQGDLEEGEILEGGIAEEHEM